MYTPKGFEVEGLDELHRFIEQHSFATLIGPLAGVPFATHLPILLDRARGPSGTLLGHVAKQNPHAELFDGKTPALVIFTGPHAYVSPSWYSTANVVPTWLYTAVHAYGAAVRLDDPSAVRDSLARMVAAFEGGREHPWSLEHKDEEYLSGLQQGIVAFEIPIERLEGKFKLNQTKTEADRRGTIAGLEATGDPMAREVVQLMRGHGSEGL